MLPSGFRNKFLLGVLALAAVIVSGCLGGGGSLTNLPTDETAFVKLKIRLGHVDSRSGIDPGVVSKSSSIHLQNMVVMFTSNLGDTVRDTVVAINQTGIGVDQFLSDSVTVDVSLRALRWWNIDIETHDQNDSIVHKGTAGPFSSKGGQVMDVSVPILNARYLTYEARYALPAQIYSSSVADTARVLQKIYFYRLLLEIDGVPIQDTTSFSPSITSAGSRFIFADTSKLKGAVGKLFFKPNGTGADTMTHVQSYEYVKAGEHTFKMSAFGYLEGDSIGRTAPRLLFQGQSKLDVIQTGIPDLQTVKLDWIGPGSETAKADSANPANWSGIQMNVTLGRVRSGGITVGINSAFPE